MQSANAGKGGLMDKPEITWERTLLIWWSFFWRFIVLSLFAGVVLGYLGGVVVTLFGRADLSATVGAALGWLASIPISIWTIRKILTKTYPRFSVRLMDTDT
ncbi:MAG: hypothetical protein HY082_06180 [Gammaproteobacteria bacterium]|nr:hypothetical protein [Gammaproteobacteria bacterium]